MQHQRVHQRQIILNVCRNTWPRDNIKYWETKTKEFVLLKTFKSYNTYVFIQKQIPNLNASVRDFYDYKICVGIHEKLNKVYFDCFSIIPLPLPRIYVTLLFLAALISSRSLFSVGWLIYWRGCLVKVLYLQYF